MKRTGLLLIQFLFVTSLLAQSTDFSVHLHSGLFSFGGKSVTQHSFIIVSDVASIDNYTNNPYGKKNAFSYGFAFEATRITRDKLILGLQAGHDVLKSNVQINGIAGEFPNPAPSVTSGQTTLTHGFITLFPHVGTRFDLDVLQLDLEIGPEFGFTTFTRENGEATLDNGLKIETDTERNGPATDIRVRPDVTIHYQSWGLSAAYSYGLRNYTGGLTGAERERFSRFIRFGITYTFK